MAVVKFDARRLHKVRVRLVAASDRAAMAMARGIARESQALVPYDTRALKRSLIIRKNRIRGSVSVIYGSRGKPRKYAAIVHNRPAGTMYRMPGTQSRFLAIPLLNAKDRLNEAASVYREALR